MFVTKDASNMRSCNNKRASLVAKWYRTCLPMQEMLVRYLGWEDSLEKEMAMKKEFIGPGLHLRPVHADHAQPPFQWTLNSVFSAYENNNRRISPPPDKGTLKIVSR